MLRVGLTGGIGSGKTTVARIFEVLGIPTYNADKSAKELMNMPGVLRSSLVETFGNDIYNDAGLDRAALAKIVFNNPAELAKLNSLVHPATIAHAMEWMATQKTPYIIKEAALIFEAGSNAGLDYVIGVAAPEALRIKRTAARDKLSETDIRLRMQRQMNEDEKMKRCDFILVNNEEQLLVPQVLQLHEKLLSLAAS